MSLSIGRVGWDQPSGTGGCCQSKWNTVNLGRQWFRQSYKCIMRKWKCLTDGKEKPNRNLYSNTIFVLFLWFALLSLCSNHLTVASSTQRMHAAAVVDWCGPLWKSTIVFNFLCRFFILAVCSCSKGKWQFGIVRFWLDYYRKFRTCSFLFVFFFLFRFNRNVFFGASDSFSLFAAAES